VCNLLVLPENGRAEAQLPDALGQRALTRWRNWKTFRREG